MGGQAGPRGRAEGVPRRPEGFPRPDGSWFPYPLETPQTGDVVVRQTAAHAIGELERLLDLGTDQA
ncbi:hypothetical protein GCM10010302_41180 [Streptomyces polychromogenes]|uniref:Uncharacterized protein n=1 Tax=Streptomyces polychromogenes TaxID=67342 RepID=A0ABN0VG60_9ACTN